MTHNVHQHQLIGIPWDQEDWPRNPISGSKLKSSIHFKAVTHTRLIHIDKKCERNFTKNALMLQSAQLAIGQFAEYRATAAGQTT